MKTAIASALCLLLASLGLAQQPSGKKISLDKSVLVDRITSNIVVFLPPKTVPGWDAKSNWTVVAIDKSGNVQKVEIKDVTPDATNAKFSLVPVDTSAVTTATQLIIRFADKAITIFQVPAPESTKPPTLGLQPGSSRENADLYLSGTYSPSLNSPPQYQIDGFVALMKDLNPNHLGYGQIGAIGSVMTDKRKHVDPDSFRVFAAYQNTPVVELPVELSRIQGVLFTWLVGGGEFDRKGTNINFITAPYLDFPIRVFPREIRPDTVTAAVLTASLGVEAGRNFYNAVTPDRGRGVFRGVVGGTFTFKFNPKVPGFNGAQVTSAYALRLPATEEIFTSTKIVDGQSVDVPFFSTKPRHYIKQQLDLKLTDALSLALKHEYGAIPPVFRMVDHKVSVGLTFALRQTRDGVPRAIRNK